MQSGLDSVLSDTVSKVQSKGETRNSLDTFKGNSNSAAAKGLGPVESSAPGEKSLPMMAPCKAKSFVLVGSQGGDGLFDHLRVFCKTYSCEFCGPRKISLLKMAFKKAMESHKLDVFLTLTLNPKSCSAEDSIVYIRKCWNKFRILSKRHFKQNISFLSVIELQKNGYAHLHILLSKFMSHTWIKDKWQAVGGGSIVDIRRADAGTAIYIAKYLGKQMPKLSNINVRAYSTSQDIKLWKLIARVHSETDFEFMSVRFDETRDILNRYVESDILDSRGKYILGFKANRPLRAREKHQRKHTLEAQAEVEP
ncbi:MAG: hypothetical protein K2X47_11705 [Bdellovibrionales bacterium]|nr:hypothetical protein [Bdellovibrionales bacterium]